MSRTVICILQNILQYITKDRNTSTYIADIEQNLGECMYSNLVTRWPQFKNFAKREPMM
jgi:hypothetical protein